jgi:NAD(P)-dependent dehydrogenase (short-subunit alcohol dehydrogenase family)
MSGIPPSAVTPSAQIFDEALGQAPGRGRMAGRRVVVVGGGQRATVDENPPVGNGRAISLLCAREGAIVAVVDVSREAAEATAAQIGAEGGQAIVEVADIGDAEQADAAITRCHQRLGGFDGLAMVAGISHGLPLASLDVDKWDREFAVNLRSNMIAARRALELMDDGSAIVLMSSIAAYRSGSGNPAYETSKAGQTALCRGIAVAGQQRGIRCNVVLPGFMDTPMGRDATRRRPARVGNPLPFGRQGTGWEVAYPTLFLLSRESSFVNGHALVVDGGSYVGVGVRAKSDG